MSFETIKQGAILELTIARPSVLTAAPDNTGDIYYSTVDADPEVLSPGERIRVTGRGSLEISGDGQRYRLDPVLAWRAT